MPYLAAGLTALAWLSFGAFWLANAGRVGLSYQLHDPHWEQSLARYQYWEKFFIAATWYLALGSVLPLLVQLVTWPLLWRANHDDRLAKWLMVVSTPLGLALLGLLALAASVSVGGGMIG